MNHPPGGVKLRKPLSKPPNCVEKSKQIFGKARLAVSLPPNVRKSKLKNHTELPDVICLIFDVNQPPGGMCNHKPEAVDPSPNPPGLCVAISLKQLRKAYKNYGGVIST